MPTFSPVSEAGHMRSSSRDGPTIEKSGPEVVHVNPLASPARERPQMTSATCGPSFFASSASNALQQSLENRLQAALDVNGSPEYSLTWKIWDMPSGPQICALRASERLTSDSGCSGWPTPTVQEKRWSFKAAMSYAEGKTQSHHLDLGGVVQLAGWPTPAAREPGGTPEQAHERKKAAKARGIQIGTTEATHLSHAVQLAVWLPCLDGKARHIESSIHPLAHGFSGRVGRLRGYGNAIVPQVAAAFVRAFLYD
jgi:hypothetical protein